MKEREPENEIHKLTNEESRSNWILMIIVWGPGFSCLNS